MRGERSRVDAFGARAVADHGERRGDLRLGDRRRERIELGVGDVAQVADRSRAIARQHIERVGEIGAAVLARVGGVGDELRSRSSASLKAASGTAILRSRARVRKSVT